MLDAAPAIPLHAFAAMAAFVLGSIQLAVPKGTLPHRTLGWIWVILMLVVAGSSFWIHQIQLGRSLEPDPPAVDLLAGALVLGVMAARSHNVRRHRFTMIGIFFGALLIAGLFTLMPGRIMHAVVFGQ
ncbi:DUF2306 domain-containing protein [Bradyrhizobium elkanii]|uniref:DUF2306 domain-containing protein n=1 Tax=Bradyrhizobium elkanii TaxID=29448 RepID=UPI003516868C